MPYHPYIRLAYWASLVWMITWMPLSAQEETPNYQFKHITSADGLSHNSISAILQDSDGIMWIGTFDGLNRYDGRSFQTFYYDETDATSISNNTIWDIIESKDGDLWMSTYKGLNRYSKKTGQFDRYLLGEEHYKLNDLIEDIHGNIWIASIGVGLIQLKKTESTAVDAAEEREASIFSIESGHLSENNITALYYDPSDPDVLWLGTISGLSKMNIVDYSIEEIDLSDPSNNTIIHTNINNIVKDKDGALWLGTSQEGIIRYDTKQNIATSYNNAPTDDRSISGDRANHLCQDDDGDIWVALYGNGISVLKQESDLFTRILNDPNDALSLNSNNATVVYADKDDNIWIGTSGGGINFYNPKMSNFQHYKNIANDELSLSSNHVSNIMNDSKGYTWVGTHGTGINRIEFSDDFQSIKKNKHYQVGDGSGLKTNRISKIYETKNGTTIIGYIGAGLSIYDPLKKQFKSHFTKPGEFDILNTESVYNFYEDANLHLWIGARQGVYRYNYKTAQIENIRGIDNSLGSLLNNGCISIIEDNNGFLWFGSASRGVAKYDPTSQEVQSFQNIEGDENSISSNVALSMMKDKAGDIWIGTWAGGLSKIDPSSHEIINYRRSDGLPNDVVYSIQEDANNDLWLSTNKGVSHFNPRTERFKNYSTANGLQGEEYNSRSGFIDTTTNTIFFGGVNGLNIFNPEDLKSDASEVDLYISGLTRYRSQNSKTTANHEVGLRDRSSIELSYLDHTLVFDITAINYVDPEEVKLEYQLEGVNQSWTSIGDMSEIRIINLNSGAYTLKVRALKDDRMIEGAMTEIGITVRPPWYKTWLAIVMYALLTVFLFYLFYQYRLRQLIRYQKLRIKISSDLHDDVGTLLTGVSMQSEMLALSAAKKDKKELNEISDLSREAMSKMRDIVWAIDSRKDKYENLIDRMRIYAENQLSKKNISHTFKIDGLTGKAAIDPVSRQNYYLIFKESIANVIKHSNATHVDISFLKRGKEITLIIADNGTGKHDLSSDGQGLSNIKMRAERLNGSLEIHQKDGFRVELTV